MLTAVLPPEMKFLIYGAIVGTVVYYMLKEAVADGVEKGIKNVLANSNIVRNEISAAIAGEKVDEDEK